MLIKNCQNDPLDAHLYIDWAKHSRHQLTSHCPAHDQIAPQRVSNGPFSAEGRITSASNINMTDVHGRVQAQPPLK